MLAIQLANQIEQHPERMFSQADVIMRYRCEMRDKGTAQPASGGWIAALRTLLRKRSARECTRPHSELHNRIAC